MGTALAVLSLPRMGLEPFPASLSLGRQGAT